MIGTTISHYAIIEKLGGGGLGVVYKAHDTRLERPVALKFLRPDLDHVDESKQRFIHEARAASSLQHNNICVVHDVDETDDGRMYIVMDLYEGGSLKAKIENGPLAITKALDYAIQVGEGLAAAHEGGIVHRDIKPANIIIDKNGVAKIVDFGLAKLAGASRLTRTGTTLGTTAYMSPEVLRGGEADGRSDLFSFGVLLYEMLTGHLPFKGELEPLMMYSILNDEPEPLETYRQDLPVALINLVQRCLEKDPADRYQTIREALTDLRRITKRISSSHQLPGPTVLGETGTPVALNAEFRDRSNKYSRARVKRKTFVVVLAVVGLAIIVLFTILVVPFIRPKESAPELVKAVRISDQKGIMHWPSFSPNGEYIVYQKQQGDRVHIFQQHVGLNAASNLTRGSDSDNLQPSYSPSGNLIAFRSSRDGGGIFIMGATGESVRRVTNFGYYPSWSPDEKTLVVATSLNDNPYNTIIPPSICTVDVESGVSRQVSAPFSHNPRWSPHGYRIAFSSRRIATMPAQGGSPVFVAEAAGHDWAPAWSSDGRYIVFVSDRGGSLNLWRIAVNEQTGQALGNAIPLSIPTANCISFSISKDNRNIVFVSRDENTIFSKMAVDIRRGLILGNPTEIRNIVGETMSEDLSPDGDWIAFSSKGRVENLNLTRTDGSELKKLTGDGVRDRGAKWSADGGHLVFFSNRNDTMFNVWMIKSDGSNLTQMTKGIPAAFNPALSPVDRILSVNYQGVGTRFVDLSLPLEKRTAQQLPFVDSAKTIFGSQSWSPDGEFMAGIGVTTDRKVMGILLFSVHSRTYTKIYELKTYTAPVPRWLKDSRTLVIQDGQDIVVADRVTKKVRTLFNTSDVFKARVDLIGVSRDGKALYFKRFDIGDELWMASFQY